MGEDGSGVRAVRDEDQPVPVQGGGADTGVPGVRGGGRGGVAGGGGGLPLPPHEGPADHGPPCRRRLPLRRQRHPHLIRCYPLPVKSISKCVLVSSVSDS